jgi:hypothetical protein
LFVVEEQLLTCGEDKFRTAIHTGQNSIREFHGRIPQKKRNSTKSAMNMRALPVPFPCLLVAVHSKGPGRKKGSGTFWMVGRVA